MTENTLKQVDRFTRALNPLSSNCEEYFQDYVISMAAAGNALPVNTDTATNVVSTAGTRLYSTNIGTQTALAPVSATTGLDISMDATNGEGIELNLCKAGNTDARFLFTLTNSTPFFIEAQFTMDDASGVTELLVGFRKNAAVAAARATYTDYAYIGCTRTDIKIATDLNDAGETLTDTTENMTDGETLTLRVEVSSERKVKYFMSITAATATALHVPTVSAEYQFDTGDTVIPSIRMLQHTDVCNVIMTYLKCGYLN